MTGKFYAILVNANPRPVPTTAIENALVLDDWLRLTFNQYFVYSSALTANKIYDKVKPLLDPKDFLIVVELHSPNRYGWVPQVVVDWFNRTRV